MVEKIHFSAVEIDNMSKLLAKAIQEKEEKEGFKYQLVAIERGGVPIGNIIALFLKRSLLTVKVSYYFGDQKQETPIVDLKNLKVFTSSPVLMIDDLVDTGDTLIYLKEQLNAQNIETASAVLFFKKTSKIVPNFFISTTDKWIVFPWEREDEELQTNKES